MSEKAGDSKEKRRASIGKVNGRQGVFGDCAVLVRERLSMSDVEDVPYVGLEHFGKCTLTLLTHGEARGVINHKIHWSLALTKGRTNPFFQKMCAGGLLLTS